MPTRRPNSAAATTRPSPEVLSQEFQQFVASYQELERENQALRAQLQAAREEKKTAQAEHAEQVVLLQAEVEALRNAAPGSIKPTPTPGEFYKAVTERPGILASLPLLALAINPTIRAALEQKNLSAVEDSLTDDIIRDIRGMPFIRAQNVKISYANNGTNEAEVVGWKKAVALLLTLLHHFTPAHESTLREVSRNCQSLAAGEFGERLEKLRRVYNTKLQQLEQVYKAIMPSSDRSPNYVKLVAFMMMGRLLISI